MKIARRSAPDEHVARRRLVADAKELGINVSRACEEGLAREVKAERERRWQDENRGSDRRL